jgi:3-isopropylmalate/(R)-2-methylmalate dehydratase small subunit
MIIKSKVIQVLRSNIDTDQIIPARYLTGISKTGLGIHLFEDLPDNPLDAVDHEGIKIILTLENFGCGSSREHAAWAILDRGFKVVIATSFARIFEDNCYNNGIVPVKLSTEIINILIKSLEEFPEIEIDVIKQKISNSGGSFEADFELDELKKEFILQGGFMKFLETKVPKIKEWERTNHG